MVKHRGRMRTLVAGVLVVSAIASALWATDARAAAPNFDALVGTKPYVRMFTETSNCSEIRQMNQLTGSALSSAVADMANWYVHAHAEGSNSMMLGAACQGTGATTMASKLSAAGMWTSNYRNGSYVSQSSMSAPLNFDEAADLETKAPRALATFWPPVSKVSSKGSPTSTAATLTSALTAAATTVVVESPAEFAPAGEPATWPYINSRGTGTAANAHSENTRDFVSWIRVDNELMQIAGAPTVSGANISIPVRRGLWGTGAAAHTAGTKVMSPVYIGSTSAVASDGNLSGSPVRNDPNYPLRYGIKIWQSDAYNWIADRIEATFPTSTAGYNTAWLDVSSCSNYNNADYSGEPLSPWNDPAGTKMDQAQWGSYQKAKLAGLRGLLPGMKFTANNLGGDNISACTNDLLATYDGGVMEHWMKDNAAWTLDWPKNMGQAFQVQENNWPAIYWVRWNYDYTGSEAQYKRFSYGSLLLSLKTGANRYQYGGPFGMNRPDDLYFWNWGAPAGNPTSIDDIDLGNGLYRRDFANGIVVVNPGESPVTYNLGATYYDVNSLNGSGDPSAVTSVTIAKNDAAFLLKSSGSTSTTTTPTTSGGSTTTTTRPATTTTRPNTSTTRPPSTTTTRPPTTTTTTPAPPRPPTSSPGSNGLVGYWMAGKQGEVYAFGHVIDYGATSTERIVSITRTPDAKGYWLVNAKGTVFAFGNAKHYGNANRTGFTLGETVSSISGTVTGKGYWLFTNKGRVLRHGDAVSYGDVSKTPLNGGVVGSATTPTGKGYYMVAADGGIFAFGDARFRGSMGGKPLNKPVVGIVPTTDNSGYWLVASDGGVFAFNAPFRGSTGGTTLNKPIIGMVRYGNGYLMVASDGGIFNYSNQPFYGSLGGSPPAIPISAVAATF
jgi:hypothetical protein